MSERRLISSGSPFEKEAGYSRAVVLGDFCFVAGTTGYDYSTMTMPDAIEDQVRNAVNTVAKSLDEGGFSLSDVVRVNYIVTHNEHVGPAFKVLGTFFGDIRPAATMIVAELVRPDMKFEIEATAYRPSR
ncbi:Enamine deaminase RidA, house cleaning of reactive enamine intermediates, YjgF/YER057c/UK114 family [Faunimonas pinastri]|uniref:Enamine deaminase RidA, house cleaning of reactive enamine intermediates, YjgF/YER057c/UK114 family n=1 Tax=Faunimonas pinastri TaxID=1855383 RepID=A0A1H9MDQ4_9HYPH|nr:RidA family protein [Faunimonas pinastri]SER21293.1 Enamine deaminase RidA, house cleaning of reactive enamine intermediates, YjgF/YER057c/UK114 family [Faunimonas pinastri]